MIMARIINHTLFLKWWLFMSAIMASSVLLAGLGLLGTLWEKDASKLSFVLLGLFAVMSGWCGYKTWRLSVFIDSNKTEPYLIEKIEHLMEVGWFTSDLCLSIGMMGTVIGFIMMLGGFANIDINDMATVQGLIKGLGVGMSTALYTTLTGLICSALLKIQYFNLSQAIDKVRQ